MRHLLILLTLPALGGCLAKTAVDVVTLPVRATSYGFDKLTTSQDEADRNYGRAMRKKEEREGKARRRADREQEERDDEARRDD